MKKIVLSLLIVLLLIGCSQKNEEVKNEYVGKTLDELGLVEEDVTFGGEYKLTAKITYPKNITKATPAVLLVQGMGPADMDQTMGPTKMFQDLAYGLASQGMIVMRFDKRTYLYGPEIEARADYVEFTYKEEVIDDVLLAKEELLKFKYTDKNEVFMVGHSLGGIVAPVIDQASPFTGFVMLGATPRKLTDIAIEQTEKFIEKTSDQASKDEMLKDIEVLKQIQNMNEEESKHIQLYGIYGYYFKKLDELDTLSILKNVTKPVLILHGTADFQVFSDTNYPAYYDVLKDKSNFEFHLLEGLNHIFMPTLGLGTRQEYEYENHVSQETIDLIAQFVLSH